jgi:hypothetical protein
METYFVAESFAGAWRASISSDNIDFPLWTLTIFFSEAISQCFGISPSHAAPLGLPFGLRW